MNDLAEPPGNGNLIPWLAIPGFPDYEINLGCVVRNRRTGRTLAGYQRKSSCRWYACCYLGRLHRLLAAALAGRLLAADELVCHRNGDPVDNRPCNLRLGTAKDNAADRVLTGTNGLKLNNEDVRAIRCAKGKLSARVLAAAFGVCVRTIYSIWSGETWGNLA